MDWRSRWHAETNSQTGESFERFRAYMEDAQDGSARIEAFFETPYGEELTRRLQARFILEKQPESPEDLAYYHGLGLTKTIRHREDYYGRYTVILPERLSEERNKGIRLPLVIACHGYGNSIENEEYMWGFSELAAREGFMLLLPQNTNWDFVAGMVDEVAEDYPADLSRVYLAGYSQGGNQVISAMYRMPERLAAAAPSGCDPDRSQDNFGISYTPEETERLRAFRVPFLHMAGACERAGFYPMNQWHPLPPGKIRGQGWNDPRKDNSRDPTILTLNGIPQPSPKDQPPGTGEEADRWKLEKLNHRLWLQNCAPLEMTRCLELSKSADPVERALGICAGEKRVENYLGIRHFTTTVRDRFGIPSFRLTAMEHGFHAIPVTFGIVCWNWFRLFRRDPDTGELKADRYESPWKES